MDINGIPTKFNSVPAIHIIYIGPVTINSIPNVKSTVGLHTAHAVCRAINTTEHHTTALTFTTFCILSHPLAIAIVDRIIGIIGAVTSISLMKNINLRFFSFAFMRVGFLYDYKMFTATVRWSRHGPLEAYSRDLRLFFCLCSPIRTAATAYPWSSCPATSGAALRVSGRSRFH